MGNTPLAINNTCIDGKHSIDDRQHPIDDGQHLQRWATKNESPQQWKSPVLPVRCPSSKADAPGNQPDTPGRTAQKTLSQLGKKNSLDRVLIAGGFDKASIDDDAIAEARWMRLKASSVASSQPIISRPMAEHLWKNMQHLEFRSGARIVREGDAVDADSNAFIICAGKVGELLFLPTKFIFGLFASDYER